MKHLNQILVTLFLILGPLSSSSAQDDGSGLTDHLDDFDNSLEFAQSLDVEYAGWLDYLHEKAPCPCSYSQVDFEVWDDDLVADLIDIRDYFHPGADQAIRSDMELSFRALEPGQQCTYDNRGRLIVGGAGAGTPDLWSPGLFGDERHDRDDVAHFTILGWQIYTLFWRPDRGRDDLTNQPCSGDQIVENETPITLSTEHQGASIVEDPDLPIQRLPDAYVGSPYTPHPITIIGHSLPFEIEVTGGTMPPGLELSDNNLFFSREFSIEGTPEDDAANAVYTFTITVDENFEGFGLSGSQTYEIVVRDGVDVVDTEDIVEMEEIESSELEIGNLLDLIFVIDTTGSMEDDIAEVRANALRILDRVAASGADWRISIVTYRDHPQAPYGDPGDYPSRVELNFSSDYGEITDAINGIRIGGGADFHESVYSGLHTAISQSWRPGVRKVIILMGDAPPHDPEPITDYTHNSVLQSAYDADPVSIYPIQIADDSSTRSSFQDLADGSSGRLFTARTADDVVDTLVYTVTSITEIPELARELTPGSLAEVMTAPSSILPLRQDPTLASSVLENLQAGSRVTVLAGAEYADGYLWWNIESATGTRGWSVEAVGGIQTLIPLTDTRPVPFRDHFYDNRAGWEISLTGNAVTSLIRDGLYTIVASVTDQFEYWIVAPGFENWSLAPIFDEPYEVEFRVLDVQASSGGYGLAILFDVQQGYKPHKRLFLNSDGTWQLFRWTGVRELLGEGVLEGGPINLADRRSHVIKLRVETDQYTVFVDDNQVLQIPSVDPILGTVGFGVAKGPAITGDRITIRFDDLVVRSLVED